MLIAFSKKSQRIVDENGITAYNIKENRIRYFKSRGLDLGNNYEAYEENDEAKKLMPDSELVENLEKIYEECEKDKEIEYYVNTGNYEECKNNILSQGLRIQDAFCAQFVQNGKNCLSPNIKQNPDGTFRVFNIIHLNIPGILEEYKDVHVIHEILHAVETTGKQTSDNEFYFKTGLDNFTERILGEDEQVVIDDKKDDDTENRKYELLSENLHQELAIRVTRKLHEKGIFLFDDPIIAREKGGTEYERYSRITVKFQNDYMDNIIDGMVAEDPRVLTDVIGEENLEKLNECVQNYAKIPYYTFMDDYINKRDTELTRSVFRLITKGEETVVKMHEFQNKKYSIPIQKIEKAIEKVPAEKKESAIKAIKNDLSKDKGKNLHEVK